MPVGKSLWRGRPILKGVRILQSFGVIFYGVLWGDSWVSVRDSSDSAVNLLSVSNPSEPLELV